MICGTCQNERRVVVIGDPALEKYPCTTWGELHIKPPLSTIRFDEKVLGDAFVVPVALAVQLGSSGWILPT